MKLPISWLKEYVDVDISAEKLADKLTMTGLEVESVESSVNFTGVVIGEVLERTKHPNADKLNVAKVNIGNKILQIVCGAPNLNVGQKVPVALIGAKLGDSQITKANLRGIESNGMICSEKELGLGDEHAGIMVLRKDAPVGGDFAEYLGADKVLDIKIFANRPDLMSVTGLAREVSAALLKKLNLKESKVKEAGQKTEELVDVEIINKEHCPRYVARVVKGVKIAPSPKWMQERLIACGVRPINNIVDISNYVMLEMGQPLHFFDLDKVRGKNKKAKIVVRNAKKGEEITTLDGIKRKLTSEMLVIADETKAIALAGVMGGANTEVDEKTKDILIEAAVFEKANIRRTSRALGLRSEAVARFEKGIPLTMSTSAIDRAAELLGQVAGAEITRGQVDDLTKWVWVQHVGLNKEKLKDFLGIEISGKEIVSILHRLGFAAEEFDIVAEAKRHLGKPYKWGASFKTDGTEAFDCGYLVDYIFSLIGHMVGHTAPQIMESSSLIEVEDLRPGDVLFRNGIWKNVTEKERNGVSHVAMYIGNGQVIHAENHNRVDGEWEEMPGNEQKVRIDPLSIITEDPHFIRAGRLVENLDDYIAVTVPWWRTDVKNETDLYEEVARIWGYEKIPSTLPVAGNVLAKRDAMLDFVDGVRKLLADIGLTEILTYSFIGKKELQAVGEDLSIAPVVANPLVSEQEYMRTSLVPHMLQGLAENQFNKENVKFYEIGKVFKMHKSSLLPEETRFLCIGEVGGEGWPIKYESGKEFYELKGVLARLFAQLNIDFRLERQAKTGARTDIMIGNEYVGNLSEIEGTVADKFGLKRTTGIMTLNLDKLCSLANNQRRFEEFSKYPKVSRDISVVFGDSFEVGTVKKNICEIDKLIYDVRIVDIYKGKPLTASEKSVTYRLDFWSKEKTLTDSEVDNVMKDCLKAIEKYGGKIRGGA